MVLLELAFALLDEEPSSCLELCGDINVFVFAFNITLLGLLFPLRVNIRFTDDDVDCAALAYSKNCCCNSNLDRNYMVVTNTYTNNNILNIRMSVK